MATKDPTQKAKLQLKAVELALTTDVKDDYYLQPKLQKCLNMDDLAKEVAALSTRQEDAEEIARTGRDIMRRMMWYLSAGYSVSTPLGYFRPTAQGVFMEAELNESLDRSRLILGIKYSMSEEMREALDAAEIDVEIQKSISGPQLFTVVSAQDAEHPEAVTRGEGVPISGGQVCVIKAKNAKVGGEGDEIGVTLTRMDGDTHTTYFFPPSQLYPNTLTRIGFVMPADAPQGSVWSVTLCTQLGADGQHVLKTSRAVTMENNFVVGEVAEPVPGGGGSEPGSGDEGSFG